MTVVKIDVIAAIRRIQWKEVYYKKYKNTASPIEL